MRRHLVVAVTCGLVGLLPSPGIARTTPPAEGRRCSYSAITDPTADEWTQTAEINGGPLVADVPGATIELICTIQVGATNSTHAGEDLCAVSSSGIQVAVVVPTMCSYLWPEGQPVYLCVETVVNGARYYWDAYDFSWNSSSGTTCDVPFDGEWASAWCPTLRYLGGTHLPGGVLDVYDDGDLYVLGTWITDCRPHDNPRPVPSPVDDALCGGGDVTVFGIPVWDCPPYGDRVR